MGALLLIASRQERALSPDSELQTIRLVTLPDEITGWAAVMTRMFDQQERILVDMTVAHKAG